MFRKIPCSSNGVGLTYKTLHKYMNASSMGGKWCSYHIDM